MTEESAALAHRIATEAALQGRQLASDLGEGLLIRVAAGGMSLVDLSRETLALAHCSVGLISLSKVLFDKIAEHTPEARMKFFPIFLQYLQQEFDDIGIRVKISIVEEDDDGKDLEGRPGMAGGP